MKEIIKKWLGILSKKEVLELLSQSVWKEVVASQDDTLEKVAIILESYNKAECFLCKKKIIAHYGGFYRDMQGRVFCSHACIDLNQDRDFTAPNVSHLSTGVGK